MTVSPRAVGNYEKFNTGLDHVLALLLKGDDAVPTTLRLHTPRTTTEYEAWRSIRVIAADRRDGLAERATRRLAKRKLKRKETEGVDTEKQEETIKPSKVKKEETKKPKEKPKVEPVAPVVKMLDLSGANVSPVITQVKVPVKGNLGSLSPHEAQVTTLLPREPAKSPRSDMLTRLQRLPLLENVEPSTNKYRTIVKWLESDDGKNEPMSASLSTMINKLQKNGIAISNGGNGRASAKPQLHVGSETLDELLKKERKSKRKSQKATKNGVKTESKRRKATNAAGVQEKTRKRRLGGFVVDSDEEEDEGGDVADDGSEAEYESGEDASSSDDERDFEIEVDPQNVDGVVKIEGNPSVRASPRKATPPASSKASPRFTSHATQPHVDGVQTSLTGKEQLASVAAKLRELDSNDASESTPTYLTYAKTQPTEPVEPSAAASRNDKSLAAEDGTSESNAIVLDDSDDEDDDDDDESMQEMVIQPRVATSAVAAPPTPPRKQQQGSKQPKATSNPASKTAAKAKATVPAAMKRKNAVESDEDSDLDEAEFAAPGEDEDSSTDADEDLFDLNEEDVYVVESILEVKKGRTLMTNSGRYTKDPDLFLVKWEGYDEITWEPEANIPKRIINFFNGREIAKKECGYQIDKFLQRKVAKNVTTGKEEILYLIQWMGLPQAYWEVKATLPSKVHIWLEKTSRASVNKKILAGPSPRKKTKK